MIAAWLKAQTADRFLRPVRQALAERVPESASVLEVGSGTGATLLSMAPRIRRGLGVELSCSMSRFADRRARRAGFHHLRFVCADGTDELPPRFSIA